jgi:nucleoid DNA-binding protein
MRKRELAERVGKLSGVSRERAQLVLSALSEVVGKELAAGGPVLLAGLGRFDVVERKGGVGRHPATGEPVPYPPRRKVAFRAAGPLAEAIAGPRGKQVAEPAP